jgi:hypothetical protein
MDVGARVLQFVLRYAVWIGLALAVCSAGVALDTVPDQAAVLRLGHSGTTAMSPLLALSAVPFWAVAVWWLLLNPPRGAAELCAERVFRPLCSSFRRPLAGRAPPLLA